MAGMKPTKRSLPEIESAITQAIQEHQASFESWRNSVLQYADTHDVARLSETSPDQHEIVQNNSHVRFSC